MRQHLNGKSSNIEALFLSRHDTLTSLSGCRDKLALRHDDLTRLPDVDGRQ